MQGVNRIGAVDQPLATVKLTGQDLHFDGAVRSQRRCNRKAVGDDGQIIHQHRQTPRKVQRRGPAADHQNVVGFHQFGRRIGNLFAFGNHQTFAHRDRGLKGHRTNGPAVGPVDQADFAQLGQITPHGFGRNRQQRGQFVDPQRRRGAQFGRDTGLTFRLAKPG